ncbi:MAG: MBL fold metallo-hydrolase [Deltaproteobacteria bacterium]|nr:MAG: MBL fold metallo-hydrolase [Deltaproteobacteria bacterium]
MNICFWGVRGSIATPLTNRELAAKLEEALRMGLQVGLKDDSQVSDFIESLPWYVRRTAGGDTSCVEIHAGEKILIMDAGTGIRPLGMKLTKESKGRPMEINILLSHTHWDHICGIPFFVPAFNPNNTLTIYGPNPELENRLKYQQDFRFFPVPLASTFKFVQLSTKDHFNIGDVEIKTIPLKHPGGSFGYRITHNDKTIVYATDSEYKDLSADALKPFIDFFHNADLLIYDAQYTMVENVEKEDWGHSNMFTGIDMALEAGVKKLIFTHHDPTYDDRNLWELLQKAKEYHKINSTREDFQIYLAYEGLSFEV